MIRPRCPIASTAHLQTAPVDDIGRPDDPFDQHPARDLRLRRAAHGPCDLDATSKKRGLGRSFWWGRDGKHFRRTNDKRAHKDHELAGRLLLSFDLRSLDSLRTQEQHKERTGPRADERPAPGRSHRHAHAEPWGVSDRQPAKYGHKSGCRLLNGSSGFGEAGRSRGERPFADEQLGGTQFRPGEFGRPDRLAWAQRYTLGSGKTKAGTISSVEAR